MKLFAVITASLTLFVNEALAQPKIIIEIPARASPFCKKQFNRCMRFCRGPYCATECSDYLHQCIVRPKRFYWKEHHRHWHQPPPWHHKRHWHHRYRH